MTSVLHHGLEGAGGGLRHWFGDKPHTHQALDDAIEQGTLFCNVLIENKDDWYGEG